MQSNQTQQILFVNPTSLKHPSPNKTAMDCGLTLAQSIFGYQTEHCVAARNAFDNSGLNFGQIYQLFQSYGINPVSFRLISLADLESILKTHQGALAIVYLRTQRHFMGIAHYTLIGCDADSVLKIVEPSDFKQSNFVDYMNRYGYDPNQIHILQGVKLSNPMNEAIVTFPTPI